MRVDQYEWNPPERLPPVGCPLVVLVEGEVWHVERTGHLQHKGGQMQYLSVEGLLLTGRYPWSYP